MVYLSSLRLHPLYNIFNLGITDSFENITHSFCSLEFEIRRELYYWILKELDLYRPVVWEYSRLNIRLINNIVIQFCQKENYIN